MTVAVKTAVVDQTAELRRHSDVLVEKGYPALMELTEAGFRELVAPLEEQLPAESFVLVVTGALVPPARLIELTTLNGKPGFTTMTADDLARVRRCPTGGCVARTPRQPPTSVAGRRPARARR